MKPFRDGVLSLTFALTLAAIAHAQTPPAGEASAGEDAFQAQCSICHVSEGGGQGPSLLGVYGRKAGGSANFAYSDAIKGSNVIWTDPTLDPYLANPQKFIPGAAMPYAVSDAKVRADIIAYLKTLK